VGDAPVGLDDRAERQFVAPREVARHRPQVPSKLGLALEERREEVGVRGHVLRRRAPHDEVVRLRAEEIERERAELAVAVAPHRVRRQVQLFEARE